MTISLTTNMSNSLRRWYNDEFFKTMQEDHMPLWDEFDEAPKGEIRGTGWFFPFRQASAKNFQYGGEGQATGLTRQRADVQAQVQAVEFVAWFEVSDLLKNVGVSGGAWNGGIVPDLTQETAKDLMKGLQRLLSISHGTGRVAVVQDSTVGTNAFVAKNNEGVQALKVGDLIDVFDLDTGGTAQMTDRTITAIDRATRTVRFSGAPASLTANWSVYIANGYGQGGNGFHGLIDNGVNTDLIHGQSRTTNPGLKAQVQAAGGTPRDLTEALMIRLCNDIYHAGGEINRVMCNTGVMERLFTIQQGDRRYNVEGGKGPKYNLGYKEGDFLWSYDKGSYVVKLNPNFPARSMYMFNIKDFKKLEVKKAGWLDEGGQILRLLMNGTGIQTTYIAVMNTQINYGCVYPAWQGELRDLKDPLAGDTF